MIKVLMVGPSLNTKGGMSTVVKGYMEDLSFNKHVNLKYLATVNDENRAKKISKMLLGLIEYLLIIWKYQIVHVNVASRNSTYRKSIYINIAALLRKKIVIHVHGGAFQNFFTNECSAIQQRYIMRTFNKCDKLIVLSSKSKAFFSQFICDEKISIINNGVTIPQYTRNSYASNIVYLGRLESDKGIYDLIDAMSTVAQQFPSTSLKVAGSGEDDKVIGRVNSLNLQSNIKLLGWIDNSERDQILRESSILVLPSYFEAMPMVVLEAMSYECIIVSTNVGGIPDLIKNGHNGILVEPGNVDELTRAISSILTNPADFEEFGKRAKQTIVDSYDNSKELKKLLSIYDTLN